MASIKLPTCLALLVIPLFPALGQWSRLPGDATHLPAAGTKTAPAVCSGPGATLAVWSDVRSNPYGSSEYETASDIFGIRLSSAGAPLDPAPIPIACDRAAQTAPRVAWNGTHWLVVYQTTVLDGNGGYYQAGLAARRVAPDGRVVDAQPIPLYGLVPVGNTFDVASDGNNWVVVNQGGSATNDVVAVRISPGGQVLDPPIRSIVTTTYYLRFNFRLAYAGGVFLLTFDDQYDNGGYSTGAVRFDSNLNLLTPGIVQLHPNSLSGLASNGTQFLFAWGYQRPDFYIEVRAKRLLPNGTLLDGNGLILSPALYPGPQIAGAWWDGANYRIGWTDFTTPKLNRVSPAGAVLDGIGSTATNLTFGPASANGAGGLQFVGALTNGNDTDIRAQLLTGSSSVGTPVSISTGAPQQNRSDIAAGASGYLAAWQSAISGVRRVTVLPLDGKGRPLRSAPIQLASGNLTAPRVAWNGALYLVTWATSSAVFFQRVDQAGNKVDPQPVQAMATVFGDSDTAAVGSDFLITARKSTNYQVIFPVAVRVRGSDGAVLDGTPKTVGTSYTRTAPVVVALGGKWLVVSTANWTHNDSNASTVGCFMLPDGTVQPIFSIHGIFSTAGGNGIFELGLASNGTTAILVQPQELTSGVENDLLVRTIAANGAVGPTINITPWEGNQYRPKAAWDGQSFVIVYQEQRNRFSTWTMDTLDARSDIHGIRITAGGTVLDPQGFMLGASALAETDPNVACLGGSTLITASRMIHRASPPAVGGVTILSAGPPSPVPGEWFVNYRVQTRILGAGGNRWPVAVGSADVRDDEVPMAVNFSSTGSSDLDGVLNSYRWDFGDGTVSNLPNPTHTYLVAGDYLATLTVTDNRGASTQQTLRIIARKPNIAPIVTGTQSVLSGRAPLDVTFTATGSYDPDGYVGNTTWTTDEGGLSYGSPSYFTFSAPGTRTVTLTIQDARGAIGTKTFVVQVLP